MTGSGLRVLMERPWRRRVLVISAMTALLAVLLEPAGRLYTVYASFVLRWSTVAISVLIVVSGIAGAVRDLAGGYLTDRFGRRGPAIALTVATGGRDQPQLCHRVDRLFRGQRVLERVCQREHAGLRGVVRRAVPDPSTRDR